MIVNEIIEILLYISSFFTASWIILQVFYYRISTKYDVSKLEKKEEGNEKISIIVAIKDEDENTVKGLIENLSKLDYDNYDVVVISDDNQDKFEKLCRKLDKIPNNFIMVRRENNQGRKAGALNYALKLAKGDVLVFLDSEARVDRDFLKKISAFSAYDALSFRLRIREVSTVVQKIYANTTEFVMNTLFKARSTLNLLIFPNGSAMAIKKSILIGVKGWKEGKVTEDLELGIRLALNGVTFKYIDSIVIYTLAPYTLTDLYNQIKRWAYGSAELFFYSLKLFKLGAKGVEGFIYAQQWGIYPLFLLMLIISLGNEFLLKINYLYVFACLIPILFSLSLYMSVIRVKGEIKDYRPSLVTLLASMVGYIQGFLRIKFRWKVTPKEMDNSENNYIISAKITGLLLASLSYLNAIYDRDISSIILLILAVSFLLI
ncbi:glycosyl transferase family 2 [Sulfolobus sp. A20]|uniref:glycosyltransferase n=1 Tax=Saccharolobus sp. A20 TaxID=1891280 RepID=UPI000863B53F|nr:glycosyltransferase family 2 protein [Sulfolobus sp. A20]AOL17085.1 glycosyl transferase family 2 [Sulfolobus sp. A20]